MLIIQDILISDDIIEEKFFCDLSACKGACCTEGDYGAPLEQQEMETIKLYKEIIAENLPDKSKKLLETEDGFTFYKKPKVWGTTCHDDGACIFLTKNELGISVCGIEKTWYEGKIPFQKPISCHLYPIRISKNDIAGFRSAVIGCIDAIRQFIEIALLNDHRFTIEAPEFFHFHQLRLCAFIGKADL